MSATTTAEVSATLRVGTTTYVELGGGEAASTEPVRPSGTLDKTFKDGSVAAEIQTVRRVVTAP